MSIKNEPTQPIDPEIEEAKRRLKEYKEGKAEAIPGEQVDLEIREKYFKKCLELQP